MSPADNQAWSGRSIAQARAVLDAFANDREAVGRIAEVSDLLAACFREGGKVLICGNGGSCADAMHFAEELTGRFRAERSPLGAIACTDPGHITCTSNDYGYERVFARWVSALGRRGDVLIVLSTSGESRNLALAVEAAKGAGLHTVGLLGRTGGGLKGACAHQWIVGREGGGGGGAGAALPSDRIQEVHMLVLHMLIEGVERRLFPELYKGV